MQRAGVFIGVNSTGHLQTLHDARRSAESMHAWAVSQGMKDGQAAQLITDESSPVTPDRIAETVLTVIDQVAPEQLLVYFAGHGVVIKRSEQWLLSKAPEVKNHAVDVREAAADAEYGAVPHVVLISDACRTAPDGIQAGGVTGGTIFPNRPDADQAYVDLYYACGLGRPAAELRDAEESVASYRAVYTEVMLDALRGKYHAAMIQRAGDPSWYTGTRPLSQLLAVEVPKRIRSKRLKARYHQAPQARVASNQDMWLARLAALPRTRRLRGGGAEAGPPPGLLEQAGSRVVSEALAGNVAELEGALEALEATAAPGAEDLVESIHAVAEASRLEPIPSACGFRINGARVIACYTLGDRCAVTEGGTVVQVAPGPPASLVMRFDSGLVSLLPAIPDFVATLVFDSSELISVSYEPAPGTWRGDEYAARAEHLRALRAVAASCSLHGRFELDVEDPADVASSLQLAKGIDPTMAIYAAHAYSDQRNVDRIRSMSALLTADIGFSFFDLALLGRELVGRAVTPSDAILPALPLLTQSWSIARSYRTRFPDGLAGVQAYARDSLWSVYAGEAFSPLQEAIARGEMR